MQDDLSPCWAAADPCGWAMGWAQSGCAPRLSPAQGHRSHGMWGSWPEAVVFLQRLGGLGGLEEALLFPTPLPPAPITT